MSYQEQPSIVNVAWDAGSHMSFCKSISATLMSARDMGMYAVQFFLGSPKSYKRHRVDPEDVLLAQQTVRRFPMHVFSHAPYLYNLAGSKKSLAWDGDQVQDRKTLNMLKELQYELSILSNFDTKRNGVIVHPGNYTDRKLGLAAIAKSINKLEFAENSKLLLENAAGQGTSLCTSFREIREIIDQVDGKNRSHVGVCVDTAHIHGVGEYNLSKCEEVDRMFLEFDQTIGLERFTLLHLNDSEVELGSRKDRHALLGTGYIWRNDFSSLVFLLSKCREHGIPVVLETSPSDMSTLCELSKTHE